MSFKTHLFICVNGGENPTKCASKGSESLVHNLKQKCKESFGNQVRVNKSGCLGFCEKGISTVFYPQNKWHFSINKEDESFLFEEIQNQLQTDQK